MIMSFEAKNASVQKNNVLKITLIIMIMRQNLFKGY